MRVWIALIALCVLVSPAAASPEANLRRALVGRHVMVPFDMPVNYLGVDFDGDHDMQRDDDARLERIGMWGSSIRGGEIAVITDVRVSKREIQIVLGKGGLTTTRLLQERNPNFRMGADVTSASDPEANSMEPLRRDRDIREQVSSNNYPENRAMRAQSYQAIRDTVGMAAELKRVQASRLERVGVGSRLRIRFQDRVPPQMLEPTDLMLALSEHIRFVKEDADAQADSAAPDSSGAGE